MARERSPRDRSAPLSHPSPTSAPTPGPAATPKAAAPRRPAASPSLASNFVLRTPFPGQSTCVMEGRSKAQRWIDDSASTGKTGSGAPSSFMEALLSGVSPATVVASQASGACQKASAVRSDTPPVTPRIVLRAGKRVSTPLAPAPDADG
ncbi:unnamed protein product [Urochloa humidicola]